MGKGYYNYEVIPLLLKKRMAMLFKDLPIGYEYFDRDYRSWNNCLKICSVIVFKQFEVDDIGSSSLNYVGLSSGFWKDKRIIGNHYSRYINFLLETNVIQRIWSSFLVDDRAINEYGYRINPELNDGAYVQIAYKQHRGIPADVSIDEYKKQKPYHEVFNPDKITITESRKKIANKWIQENSLALVEDAISDDYYNRLPNNLSLAFTKIENDGSQTTNFFSVEKAREIAKQENLSLFHYNKKNIIGDRKQFIEIAVTNFKRHYFWCISSFSSKKFNFSRNRYTRRIYGQLVSLPSTLLQFVRIHNQYIYQVDLKCSQFTIFANVLNQYIFGNDPDGSELVELFQSNKSKDFIRKLIRIFKKHEQELPKHGVNPFNLVEEPYYGGENDIYKFLQDVFFHDFYMVLRSNLNLQSRAHAKLWTFTILFGSTKTNNVIKKQMSNLYPTLIEIIDDFKRTFKSNEFSVGLQQLEAEIFIDNIWNMAKKRKVTSFTRHDSLLFAISKRKEVEQIIEEVRNKFKFIGNFEYEIFNEDAIDREMLNDSDYIDSISDVDDLDVYTHFPDPNTVKHPFQDYYQDYIELMKQLVEIGVHDDYYGVIDSTTMEEISQLPFLKDSKEQNYLLDEVLNMHEGYGFFQPTTNEILREMISILSQVDFDWSD